MPQVKLEEITAEQLLAALILLAGRLGGQKTFASNCLDEARIILGIEEEDKK